MSMWLSEHVSDLTFMCVCIPLGPFFMVVVCLFASRDRSRERHKASSSKDSSRSERSVVINPPDTPSQESPVHNGEPLPGEPTPTADHGDDAQVFFMEVCIGVTRYCYMWKKWDV